ncbi:MAG: hypothetical protein ILP11_00955, partial [Alphaproteobacteria bacterium]|nr:hypothetical protein [Alphaproteobacteria bacterium]
GADTDVGPGATECNCPTGSDWNKYVETCEPPSCDTYVDCPASANYVACVEHLCKEYTPVEYIQSSGSQYINTAFYPTTNSKIDIKFMYTELSSGTYTGIFGSNGSTTQVEGFRLSGISSRTTYIFGTDWEKDSNSNGFPRVAANTIYTYTMDKNSVSLNSWSRQDPWNNPTISTAYETIIFGRRVQGSANLGLSKSRIFYCKLWTNGSLVRDFRPAYDENNKAGMYDNVSHTMFYDANGGNFTYPAP